MIRGEPTDLNLPDPAHGALAVQPHTHDPLTGPGLLGLAAFLDLVAHQGLTILSATAMLCGILYGGFNCYIAWRNSESRMSKYRLKCFRDWEGQRKP